MIRMTGKIDEFGFPEVVWIDPEYPQYLGRPNGCVTEEEKEQYAECLRDYL